ncbi:MFS transporter [Amycolatopsis sp. NEAU-NG30]|uniref:MFS transporter n=1 Tax=Amycolatopsis melonis TaxID=3156488 RepID=A0ABV0L741_9PSEU
MRPEPPGKAGDLRRLWLAQTVSAGGSQVSAVVVPLIAVTALHAGPFAVGVVQAMRWLPLLGAPLAGVWVDRHRRRPTLLACDMARCSLLLLLVAAWYTGTLGIGLLAVVLGLIGVLTVLAETAYFSYVPALVGRDRLASANGALEAGKSGAQAVGSTAGGGVLNLLAPPLALLLDAASYVFSALMLSRIRRPEPPVRRTRGPLWTEMAAGLRFVAGDRTLRAAAVALALSNTAWAGELALHVPYLSQGLGLSPLLVGVAMAGVGPGAVLGALLAGRLSRRLPPLPVIAGGLGLFGAATSAVPLVPADPRVAVPVLLVSGLLAEVGGQVSAITVITLRQHRCPDRLLGRVNAAFRFAVTAPAGLGALAAGAAAAAWGTPAVLSGAILLMTAAPLALLPVLRSRSVARMS